MDPWRFEGGAIKIVVMELKYASKPWLAGKLIRLYLSGRKGHSEHIQNAWGSQKWHSTPQSFYGERKGLEGVRGLKSILLIGLGAWNLFLNLDSFIP